MKDATILSFVESGLLNLLRGWFSGGGNLKFASENNDKCPSYDQSKEKSLLLSLGANSLYDSVQTMKICERKYQRVASSALTEVQKQKEGNNYGFKCRY